MRTFSEGKEAGTVTRHLHVISPRSRRKNHARPYKVGPVGDVRGEASVERCDGARVESCQTFRERRRLLRLERMVGAWVDVP
jgi:hypothetical protein